MCACVSLSRMDHNVWCRCWCGLCVLPMCNCNQQSKCISSSEDINTYHFCISSSFLGHILKVQIPEFCGIRNVPFCFVACSQECRDRVDLEMKHILRSQRQRLAELEEKGVWLARHLYQVECSDIWEMRRRSRLGRGVDTNLRADPAELVENLDLVLVESKLIAEVLGIEAVPLVDMVSPM